MTQKRGSSHTTLTETATEIVTVLKLMPGVKMIAPGIIKTNSRKGAGSRFVTIVHTHAGFELIISGQSVQKVAVHVEHGEVRAMVQNLINHKKLKNFEFKERDRKPGI